MKQRFKSGLRVWLCKICTKRLGNNKTTILTMVDLLKIVKLWHLSTEFCGVWQKVALRHRTQYLNDKV